MNEPRHMALALLAATVFATAAAAASESNPAEAWRHYAASSSSSVPGFRFPHETCFKAAALAYDLPYTLLLAVARGESDFDPMARSKANAHGVMQILWPTTANHLGIFRLSQLYEPCTNIDAGARYLREMLQRYGGNIHLALAAYNYGPERIPRGGGDIPDGATWYSGYILRHLNYIVGDGRAAPSGADRLYSDFGRSTLLTFGEPYRAEAFVAGLEQRAPGVQLDWFRQGTGAFAVVLVYEDRDAFDRSASLLRLAGFRLDP
ncbi:MAG: lytic transglycosylase domain-containing protein [Woeseiaceae bacterium]|nr:lytic transglycosylase domain-containing protein [Woeseiaceae bacterium]